MRLSTLCIATLLTFGAVGMAHATPNLVTNGDFSQTSPNTTVSTQFSGGSTYGEFVTDWYGNKGYEIWYPSGNAAVTENARGEYSGSGKEKLYGTAASLTPPSGNTFVGLDGDQDIPGVQAGISQAITGLISGKTYTVTFEWGAAQFQSRTGITTEYLSVSLGGGTPQVTNTLTNASESFTGWYSSTLSKASFTFTADDTGAGWNVLNFLSFGTPTGNPPVALLTNVSMTQNVPEPSDLAMFGGGLFGLGMLIVFARRRELRRREGEGDSAIV